MPLVRTEVVIFDLVTVLAIISWLFLPIFQLESVNYSQSITPLGFATYFFGTKSLLVSPLTITALAFFIFSAILPMVWRSSRYSLYASAVAAIFGIVMIINSFIFQQRYLRFYGYSILPTPTGELYVLFPSTSVFGISLYLLASSSVLALINSLTRARWLNYRRLSLLEKLNSYLQKGELMRGFLTFLDSLGIYASVSERHIRVKDLTIIQGKPGEQERRNRISMYFPSGEQFFVGKDRILYVDSEGELHYYSIDQGIKLILTKIIERSDFNNELFDDNLYR